MLRSYFKIALIIIICTIFHSLVKFITNYVTYRFNLVGYEEKWLFYPFRTYASSLLVINFLTVVLSLVIYSYINRKINFVVISPFMAITAYFLLVLFSGQKIIFSLNTLFIILHSIITGFLAGILLQFFWKKN